MPDYLNSQPGGMVLQTQTFSFGYNNLRRLGNSAAFLLRRQAVSLKELSQSGYLDSIRLCSLMDLFGWLDHAHGICERIKHTPFPRMMSHFGKVFTWIFVLLLPLAFLDVSESEARLHNFSTILVHRFMYTLIPFSMLVPWVFYMVEKVGDSSEDPFEGGANDIPVSAICRAIEIDLKQAMGAEDIPTPLKPIEDVLY